MGDSDVTGVDATNATNSSSNSNNATNANSSSNNANSGTNSNPVVRISVLPNGTDETFNRAMYDASLREAESHEMGSVRSYGSSNDNNNNNNNNNNNDVKKVGEAEDEDEDDEDEDEVEEEKLESVSMIKLVSKKGIPLRSHST